MAGEVDRLLAQYGDSYAPDEIDGGGPTTSDVLAQYQPPQAPGKGERMRRAWAAYKDRAAADMLQKAERPFWGETTKHTGVPFPAKDSQLADAARTAMLAPVGTRGGMGTYRGFGRYGDGEPMPYHVDGGLGMFKSPLLPHALVEQPQGILGGLVAPMLAATKPDALPITNVDDDVLQILGEEAGRTYTLGEQMKRIRRDLRERPGHHVWEGVKQSGMWTGYTGLPEIATALAALRYLPLYLRAPEPPIRGSILDRSPAER